MASLVLTDSSQLRALKSYQTKLCIPTPKHMICKKMCLAAVTSDSQNLGIYLNVDCQKSAAAATMSEPSHSGYRSKSHHHGHHHHVHHHHAHHHQHHKTRNYKLLIDPCLVKGAAKLYRYDGNVPNDASYPQIQVRDPRSQLTRIWTRLEPLDIPVPKFKIDRNYVGKPPPVEVTICNMNDNIDRAFLTDMVLKFGEVEELSIYYHPISNRHLGLARIVFENVKSAQFCVDRLNNTSVMGKVLSVFLDEFGTKCQEIFQEQTEDRKTGKDSLEQVVIESPLKVKIQDDGNLSPSRQPPKKVAVVDHEMTMEDTERSWHDKDDHTLTPGAGARKELPHVAHQESDYNLKPDHRGYSDYPTPGSSTSDYGTGQSEVSSYTDRSYTSSNKDFDLHGTPTLNHPGPARYEYHNQFASVPPPSSHVTHYQPLYHPPGPPPNIHLPCPSIPPPPFSHTLHPPPLSMLPPTHILHPPPLPILPLSHSNSSLPWQQTWDHKQASTSSVQPVAPRSSGVTTLPPAKATPTWTPVSGNTKRVLFSPEQKKEIKTPASKSKDLSEETPVLDLDTRIELLLKGKGMGSLAPSFLHLGIGGSDSEEESTKRLSRGSKEGSSKPVQHSPARSSKRKLYKKSTYTLVDSDKKNSSKTCSFCSSTHSAKNEKVDEPLEDPPSPFISKEIYLKWHQIHVEQNRVKELEQEQSEGLVKCTHLEESAVDNDDLGSLISSSEDEILTEVHEPSDEEHSPSQSSGFSPKRSIRSFLKLSDAPPGTEPEPDQEPEPELESEPELEVISQRSTPLQDENPDDDDHMSLSSLSSGDQNIEVSAQPPGKIYAPTMPIINTSLPPPSIVFFLFPSGVPPSHLLPASNPPSTSAPLFLHSRHIHVEHTFEWIRISAAHVPPSEGPKS
uniref:RRM domain-containing protein n=1 Tax=Timema shepardi TaxID=629360 RepID=A0A7R9AQ62_TIMSH|nr:unnamed protein product [Timema shepardi]